MQTKTICLFLFLLTSLCAQTSHADQIDLPFHSDPSNSLGGSISLPEFDASLGLLMDVTLIQDEVISANVNLRNDNTSSRTVTAHLYGWLEFQAPGIRVVGDDALGVPERHFDFAPVNISLRAGETRLGVPLGNKTLHPLNRNAPSTAFSDYLHSPVLTYNYVVGFDVSPNSRITSGLNFTQSLPTGIIRYRYRPTPAPSSSLHLLKNSCINLLPLL